MNHSYIKALESHIFVPGDCSEDDVIKFVQGIREDVGFRGDWNRPFMKIPLSVSTLPKDEITSLTKGVKLKYVIFKKEGNLFPIVFSKKIQHVYLHEATFNLEDDYCEPVSAGFVLISDKGCSISGRSESLDLDSNESQDSELISKLLF